MKKSLIFLILAVLITIFSACSPDPNQLILGEWKVDNIESNQVIEPDQKEMFDKMMEEMKQNTTFVFKNDGVVESIFGDQVTKGKWSITEKDGKLILTNEEVGGQTTTSELLELTDKKMVFKEEENEVFTTITLVKK